jgi:hypothetical protein
MHHGLGHAVTLPIKDMKVDPRGQALAP